MKITSRVGKYSPEDDDTIIYEAKDDEGTASALYLDTVHHMVMQVETREDRQHEGLASKLFEAADNEIGAYLAPDFCCTDEGLGWAHHMEDDGFDVLDDETAQSIVYS